MVAPRAETLWSMRQRVVGILLHCPECPTVLGSLLRVETPNDRVDGLMPDLDLQDHRLGFIARCDFCGFRVEMKGNRLATVAMLAAARVEGEGRE